jgi:hypothetical protein
MPATNFSLKKAFLLPVLFAVLSSCKTNNNDKVIKEMEESLISSNQSIKNSSKQIMAALEDKLNDPGSHERATVWFARAKAAHIYSTDVIDFIEALKKDDKISRAQSNSLYNNLNAYKSKILAIDSSIEFEFAENFRLISNSFDTGKKNEPDFYNEFFRNSDHLLTSAMLTKFQNNVGVTENKLSSYCYNQIGQTDGEGFFNSYSAIAFQNSNYVKAGEKLEITAGIGTFSTAVMPQININGKDVVISEEGFALYKFKAQRKPGKYYVPVKISFTDANGEINVQEKVIEYTVVKPCDQ